jgi:hypothetical protein
MNGKIQIGKRVRVEGSLRQGGWNDTFEWLIPVQFNVPPTPADINKAQEALSYSKWYREHQSSWGALRWLNGRTLKHTEILKDDNGRIIDVNFIVTESWGLCD